MQHSKTSQAIIIAAIEVHRALGPGLLESVYEECMYYELVKQGIVVKRQVAVPVRYKDVELECGFRLDLVVDNLILVELKAVDKLAPIHEAQILTYLKLTGLKVGLLINFNVTPLKNGIRRFVN